MLAARYTNKKVCFFHLTPLFTKTGWYFKARRQRHSRGPFLMLQDAEKAAKNLLKQ
ncbi:MAG: hypothetical protein U9Q75_06280 [Pseudomonadota bacterium]|nr:hypothetical protein [Pseudomonadota bacterium]